jgi:predicted transcriptional regulator
VTEMPSENDVLETKKKRFRVLNTIYDLAEQDEERYIRTSDIISTYEITNTIEISEEELYLILKFLINRGLVIDRSPSYITFMREGQEALISITHEGLRKVENTIENGEDL